MAREVVVSFARGMVANKHLDRKLTKEEWHLQVTLADGTKSRQ